MQGTIRTLSGTSQTPSIANGVNPGQAVTVSCNVSGALSTGQVVYIRYTTNNFSASTVTAATMNGNVATFTIPAGTNTASAVVKYYILSSGSTTPTSGNEDLMTINVDNNTGANYSYTVGAAVTTYPYVSAGTGTTGSPLVWATAANWQGGLAPTNASNVIIQAGDFVSIGTAVARTGTTTVNGTLIDATATSTYGTLTVGAAGTFSMNSTSLTVPTATWTAGSPGATLLLAQTTAGSLVSSSLNQAFKNITVNFTGSTALSGNGGFSTAANAAFTCTNLTINGTGTSLFKFGSSSSASAVTIGGNLTVNGGTFTGTSGSGILTLSIGGNLSVTGGTFNGTSSGTPVISITGTVSVSGGTANINGTCSYTGTTSVSSTGNLTLGVNNALPVSSAGQVILNGGPFTSGGFNEGTAGSSTVTMGALNMSASTSLVLSGNSVLQFAASNTVTWAGTTLTISGWSGNPGASNTGGQQIFVGTSNTGLTSTQLAKISFSGFTTAAMQLSTGEIVPSPKYFYSQSSSALNTVSNWNTNRAGGGSSPVAADFTTGGNIFVIQGAVASGGGGSANHAMTLGTTLTIGGASANTKLEIEGGASLTATSALTFAAAGQFQIDANGTYNHNNTTAYSSTILGGVEIFDPASNFIINNTSTTGPGTPSTGFGNLTYAATASCNSGGSLNDASSSTGKAIQGSFTVSGVSYRITGNTATTFTIGGDLIINGGTLDLGNGSATPTINVGGNFNMSSGTLDYIGSNVGTVVNFTKSGTMTWSQGSGTIAATTSSTRSITFVVANGCTIDFGTNTLVSASTSTINFTLSSGAGLKTANTAGIVSTSGATSGSIQVTGTVNLSNGANYTYNGAANQITGSGLPATVNTLTIANTGTAGSNTVTVTNTGTLTIASATNPSLTLTSGLLKLTNSTDSIYIADGAGISASSGDFSSSSLGGIRFQGAGTVAGTVNFYPGVVQTASASKGVTYSSGSTIKTGLTLKVNTFVNTTAPAYASTSTLTYDIGTSYGRSTEWSATSGNGYPGNVTVTGNTILNVVNSGQSYKKMAGNLFVASGSKFIIPGLTTGNGSGVGVEVAGDIQNDGSISIDTITNTTNQRLKCTNFTNGYTTTDGTSFALTTLSSTVGGDLEVTGTVTDNATFISKNRAIFFTGTGIY